MWPFTSSYPERSLHDLRAEYDYIVVGGGTAGCVLARRLSEDGRSTVLLIERGDARNSWLDSTPLLSMYQISDGKHASTIQSVTSKPLGRSFALACGKGLGGTTRINGDQYTCGVPAQFNAWSQQGRKGWSYKDLKPYFDKSERWIGPVPKEYHGLNGPLQVRSFEDYNYDSSRRAAEAARSMGFLDIIDMHSPLEPSIGFNKMQFTLDSAGRRQSSFRAYIPQTFVEQHTNLHVCTNALAVKLEISEGSDGSLRAVGVDLQAIEGAGRRIITVRRDIILTCGALRTPQLLLLSGVGPQDHLREVGVHVVRHTPGVGMNIQDHMLIQTVYNCPLSDSLWALIRRPTTLLREIYKFVVYGTGWFLSTFAEMEIFGMSSLIGPDGRQSTLTKDHLDSFDPKNLPDIAVFLSPLADPKAPGVDRSKGIVGLIAGLLLAESYGSLCLSSLDPKVEPNIDLGYLTAPADYAALRAALRVTVAMAQEMRAAGYQLEDVVVPDISSDAALDDFIAQRADTMYHYTSSCRMAPEDDPRPGVVDDELRVHGIPNLRIADASIFPTSPATHPQALVYATAEKCADLVQQSAP